MADLPWFKLWPADVMDCSAWRKLSLEERGLLMIAFSCLGKARSEGRQATVNDVAHYAGCRVATADKALAKLQQSGYLVVEKLQLSSDFFDKMQKSKDATSTERMRRYRASNRNVTDELRRTLRVEARSKKQDINPVVPLQDFGLPGLGEATASSKAPKKNKKVKLSAPDIPDVTFLPEDESRVSCLLLLRNKSGEIAEHVLKATRVTWKKRQDEVGLSCWRHGMDEALRRSKSWEYASVIMAANPNGAPSRATPFARRDIYANVIPLNSPLYQEQRHA